LISDAGIVAALAAEARQLGPTQPRADGLGTLGNGNLVTIAGLGAAAAQGADALVRAGVKALVSFGFAGGLDPTARAGTVFVPAQVIGSGASFTTTREWRERLGRALITLSPLIGGKLLSSPRPVDSVAAKAALFHSTGAAAVDMESIWIAQVARDSGLPFIAVRVVIDTAADRVPAAAASLAGDDGRIKPASMVFAVLRRPRDLVAFVRLAMRYRVAARSLEAAALAAFGAPRPSVPAARADASNEQQS
jgi:adenosylhomocysteine nucleosidase